MIRWPLKYKIKLYIIYSKMIGDVYAMLALWHQKTLSKVFLCLHTNWTLNLVHLKDCRESCYLSFPKRNTTHYSLFINLYYFTTSFKFPATELFLLFMDVYPGRQALGLHSCKDTCLFFFFFKDLRLKGLWRTDEDLGNDKHAHRSHSRFSEPKKTHVIFTMLSNPHLT